MEKLWDDPQTKEIDEHFIDSRLEESFEIRVRDINAAISQAREALQQSLLIDYVKGEAYANCYLGYFHMICSQYQESLIYSKRAGQLFEHLEDHTGLAHVAYSIGSVHYKTDDTHLGLKYLLDSLELYQYCDDTLGQARALKAIGTMYEYLGQYENAEETYLKTIELSESIGDENSKSNALNPLSGILLRRNQVKEALETIDESIKLKRANDDTRGLAFALYGKAKVLTAQGKFEEAKKYYLQSLSTHDQMSDLLGVLMALNKLGDLHFRNDQFDEAKKYLRDCITRGTEINHHLILNKAYLTLYKIYKQEGDTTRALSNLESHILHKEKILNKEVKNVIKSIQNISKVEILEKETKWQKEINRKIESKNQELDKFVYKVSHDLRGPISSLMGLYNLVEHDVKDVTAKRYFDIYNTQVLMLNKRLTGFIDLIQIKDKNLVLKPISFDKVVEECISSFKYLPNFSKTEFNISVEENIEFQSDPSAVETIFQNLIENSIKYSRNADKPRVDINISGKEPHVFITIQDNGEGINDQHHEKIFDMFYRANTSTKGTGLGLYLVKHAIEKLKGEFSFESVPSSGTKFVIRLPNLG